MYILPVLLIKYPLGEFSVPVSPSWKPCFLACVCIFFFVLLFYSFSFVWGFSDTSKQNIA
ncbi:rCG25509 [Rattus norvegicus]|uniref:RCG25509 n=1 Tax=Rattus norvegicus TaxID=10116 RepID=A6I1I0_RAT|nr:rCG25509 [Rattus norvegicus]